MSFPLNALRSVVLTTVLAPSALADGRNPGSVLLFPMHRSTADGFTIVNVTNTNTTPAAMSSPGGTTNVLFNYVNTVADPANPLVAKQCFVTDRTETLTPADTLSVLTACHNAANAEGYLLVVATDPLAGMGKTPWSHNHLVGSTIGIGATGAVFSFNAVPYEALADPGLPTGGSDVGLAFDGVQYEASSALAILDGVLPLLDPSVIYANPSIRSGKSRTLKFDIWNDNEQPFSATVTLGCWVEAPLAAISPVFDASFLASNTLHNPAEVDLTGDGLNDTESCAAYVSVNTSGLGIFVVYLTNELVGGAHLAYESEDRDPMHWTPD